MSTKRKTTTKKVAAKKKTTAFDEALTPPASKAVVPVKIIGMEIPDGPGFVIRHMKSEGVVAVEPMEATMDDQIEEGGEPWPNYSPFPEDEDTGPGFSPANIAPVTEKVDKVVESWDEPQKEEEPVLGSGSPVDASDPVSGANLPNDAAKTVTDLIDGLNYLWKLAVTIRGPRGPKQHDESILKKRVAAGRQLLASLKA